MPFDHSQDLLRFPSCVFFVPCRVRSAIGAIEVSVVHLRLRSREEIVLGNKIEKALIIPSRRLPLTARPPWHR